MSGVLGGFRLARATTQLETKEATPFLPLLNSAPSATASHPCHPLARVPQLNSPDTDMATRDNRTASEELSRLLTGTTKKWDLIDMTKKEP